eukprot:scaffold3032_cov375-Prasinococcus_capsulatus_cf.AAC.5
MHRVNGPGPWLAFAYDDGHTGRARGVGVAMVVQASWCVASCVTSSRLRSASTTLGVCAAI